VEDSTIPQRWPKTSLVQAKKGFTYRISHKVYPGIFQDQLCLTHPLQLDGAFEGILEAVVRTIVYLDRVRFKLQPCAEPGRGQDRGWQGQEVRWLRLSKRLRRSTLSSGGRRRRRRQSLVQHCRGQGRRGRAGDMDGSPIGSLVNVAVRGSPVCPCTVMVEVLVLMVAVAVFIVRDAMSWSTVAVPLRRRHCSGDGS